MPIRSLLIALTCCIAAIPSVASAATNPRDSEVKTMCRKINTLRVQNGVAPLRVSMKLASAASWMSLDMAAKDYFSHTDSLGRSWFARINAFGYSAPAMAENIAAGSQYASSMFDLWANSAGHRANMLNPSFTVIGIGRGYEPASTYDWYWTADFGSVGDVTSDC